MKASQNVCKNVLGNIRSPNYIEIVEELLDAYKALG
jgi:hypothetical protein